MVLIPERAMADGYDPHHFALVFDAENRHFWFGARNRALRAVIDGVVSRLPAVHRVLEIGCGTGNTLGVLRDACPAAALVIGIDPFEEGLAYARRQPGVSLVRARIEAVPFAVQFQLVGMFDVLEHIPRDAATLREIRSLVEPGGYLLLTVPAHASLWSQFDTESHHCRRYEPDQFRGLLIESGFAVEYLTPFMAMLYPMARVSRWLSDRVAGARRRRGLAVESAVRRELRVRPVVNDAIAFMLRPEAALLRRRVSLPLGTSLLAVARAV